MNKVDYEMLEVCSKIILEKLNKKESIPIDIFKNLKTSIAYAILNNMNLGPNAEELELYLNSLYTYDEINNLPGFDAGAIYGSIEIIETCKDILKEDSYGNS